MTVLVTGSQGYIGAVLVKKLLQKDYRVIGIDSDFYGKSTLNKNHNFKLLQQDTRKIKRKDLKNIDAIIHLAALSNDPTGELNPKLTLDINYKATIDLAEKAKKEGIKKFIFSSSCSAYGITKSGIVNEKSKTNPLTAYAKSKILSEKGLLKLADKEFCVGILRNSTVYGYSPSFRNDLVVNNFVTCAIATNTIRIKSDGTPWRPLIDIRDLSDIFIEFLEADPKKINKQVFNIGFNENNFQVKDVLKKVKSALPKCKVIFTGEHGSDTRSYKVDFGKFRKTFPSVKQKWTLEKSIKDMVINLKKNNFSKKDFEKGKFTRLTNLKELLEKKKLNNELFFTTKNAVCRNCKSRLVDFFSLGDMPLVNSFLTKQQLAKEKKYELTTAFCKKCYLVQLNKTISPEILFRDYIYFSSNSKTILEHSEKTAKYLTKKMKLTSKNLVVEIASNDGVLLQFFKKLGIQILGIDPAKNIAKVANKKGIPTIAEFFNFSFAKKFVQKRKTQADLIYGANVLAHVPTIVDFAKGVKTLLTKKGTAVFEFPYLQGLLENKFDTIYHEHVFYYSLIALTNVFKRVDLEIYDVEMVPMQGGSLRIYISHKNTFPIKESVKKLIKKEMNNNLHKLKTYRNMNKSVTKLKTDLINLLTNIKKGNKTIAAYSAPAKGLILLNYFGINNNYLDFIVDKAKEKQGLYTPGVHMVVHPIEKILKDKPDYVLILCWNIADEVIKYLKEYKNNGGKFIIPIPAIKTI